MSDTILQDLANLKSKDIRERLDRLHADEKALRVLLRATVARERVAKSRVEKSSEEGEVSHG